jgi:hypothetical protein
MAGSLWAYYATSYVFPNNGDNKRKEQKQIDMAARKNGGPQKWRPARLSRQNVVPS